MSSAHEARPSKARVNSGGHDVSSATVSSEMKKVGARKPILCSKTSNPRVAFPSRSPKTAGATTRLGARGPASPAASPRAAKAAVPHQSKDGNVPCSPDIGFRDISPAAEKSGASHVASPVASPRAAHSKVSRQSQVKSVPCSPATGFRDINLVAENPGARHVANPVASPRTARSTVSRQSQVKSVPCSPATGFRDINLAAETPSAKQAASSGAARATVSRQNQCKSVPCSPAIGFRDIKPAEERSGPSLSSDRFQLVSSSFRDKLVKSGPGAQRTRARKSVSILDCKGECTPVAAQDAVQSSLSHGLSLPIAPRLDAEESNAAKKDTPHSIKDTPRSIKDTPRSIKDTPRSMTDTPRTMTDAALRKSQLLLEQLGQLGLSEDAAQGEAVSQTVTTDILSPVSETSTSASFSDWNTKEARMPMECMQMMKGMMQELQSLRSSESAAQAPKEQFVSLPANLLEMLVEMAQDAKQKRRMEEADQSPCKTFAKLTRKNLASLTSRASTEDAATEESFIGSLATSPEVSFEDSIEASPAASSMPVPSAVSSPIQETPMPLPSPRRITDSMRSVNLTASASLSDLGCKSAPVHTLRRSFPSQKVLLGPPRHLSRMATMPPAALSECTCVSPAEEHYLAVVARTPPALPTPTAHSPRPEWIPATSSPSPGISSAGDAYLSEKAAAQQQQQREAAFAESLRLETNNACTMGQSVFEAIQKRDAADDRLQAQENIALPSPRAQPPAVVQPSAPMHWQSSQMQPNTLRMSSPRMLSPRGISPRVLSPRVLSPRVTSPHMQHGAPCLVQRTVSITDTFVMPV